jgi:hypothetical protein
MHRGRGAKNMDISKEPGGNKYLLIFALIFNQKNEFRK